MHDVLRELEGVRRAGRRLLVVQRLSLLIAWIVAGFVLTTLADYALRLPVILRVLLLATGVLAIGFSFWRYLWPALRFRPGLVEIALRMERLIPTLRGRLASSVEFASTGTDAANPLAARSVADTQSRLAGASLRKLVTTRLAARSAVLAVLMLVATFALGLTSPGLARIATARILTPWNSVDWPARTGVESLMAGRSFHPRGQALALRARATRGPIESMRVFARQRVIVDGRPGPWSDLVLTHQGNGIYERLIDTQADSLEFSFHTDDAETAQESIELIAPPAVRRASIEAAPPAYAAEVFEAVSQELGSGQDDRSIVATPLVVGSAVALDLQLNKPVAVGSPRDAWLRQTLNWKGPVLPELSVDLQDPSRWRLSWTLAESTEISLHLVDRHGISNPDPISYRVEALEDHPASVAIVDPVGDESVLPTAAIEISADARDDVALTQAGFEVTRKAASPTDSAESSLWSTQKPASGAQLRLTETLDLSTQDVQPGDVLTVVALADDSFDLDGKRHATSHSSPRRLHVISAADLLSQIRRDLSSIRQGSIRIDAQQGELLDDVRASGAMPGQVRAQAQISERIASMRRDLADLARRTAQNRLDDAGLDEILRQADDLLQHAGQASTSATESIEQSRASGEESDRDEAVSKQEEVRSELRDLIELLDRDEDSWVLTRRITDMIDRLEQLQTQSGALAQRTMGREASQLDATDRADLDRLAQRQRDVADESRSLIDDLRKRAELSRQVDRARSETLSRAADQAEQRRLTRDLEQAHRDVQANHLQNAQGSQQSAAATLQQMQEILEDTRQAEARELRRKLASLIESITRLVNIQQAELDALGDASLEQMPERALAMIQLNRNTQDVAAEARDAGPTLQRLARTIDRAGDAQVEAITDLRLESPDAENARGAESRSLDLLKEALDAAQKASEQAEQEEVDRRRDELAAAYRSAADKQESLAAEMKDFVATRAKPLDRRALVESRRLGSVEKEVESTLLAIRNDHAEITQALVISKAHETAESLVVEVATALLDGAPNEQTARQAQWAADGLRRLASSLEREQSSEPFTDSSAEAGGDGNGQQGGSGQSDPLIPPIAELKMLRGLQEQIYQQTREADEMTDAAARESILQALGNQQIELSDLGARLIEALKNQNSSQASPEEIEPQ